VLYGDEKLLHMARSILPSSRRESARAELAEAKRAARHRSKQDLRRAMMDEDFADEADLCYYPNEKIRFIVGERRLADKLNHFVKWARERTKGLPAESRLSKVRGILPPNLIGWHAVQHLRMDEHFRPPSHPWNYVYGQRTYKHIPRPDWKSILTTIVKTPGAHRMLNRFMVVHHKMTVWYQTAVIDLNRNRTWGSTGVEYVGPERPRLLRGIGDIDDFLDDLRKAGRVPSTITGEERTERTIRPNRYYYHADYPDHLRRSYIVESKTTSWPNPDYHPEWWRSMALFVDHWNTARGDVDKLRTKLASERR
jgi:hypothetical protein